MPDNPQNTSNQVTNTQPHFGMWVAFQYVILFISLYISFTSLGFLLHDTVDKYIPDPAKTINVYSMISSSLLRWYIAALIVVYPIFAFLFITAKKQVLKNPDLKNLRARKILIYITLVGTFIIMVINLIATINRFLGGTQSLNSFAHLGITILVAGSIFVYLINEVKGDRKPI